MNIVQAKSKTRKDTRSILVSNMMGFAGQGNTLIIPRPFIDLCKGDHLAALLLSQILYWQDRTSDPDGWFSKSYEDWYEELGLTEPQIKRLTRGDKRPKKTKVFKLADVGVESKLSRAAAYNGAATMHYRVNLERFHSAVLNNVENRVLNNVQNDDLNIVENDDLNDVQNVITETTPETTPETTNTTADAGRDIEPPKEVSFDDIPGYEESRAIHGAVYNRQHAFKEKIVEVWGWPVGSVQNTHREQQLRGVATKGEWKECNLPPDYVERLEPDDLPYWKTWELSRGVQSADKILVSKAAPVQASLMAYIDAGKPRGSTNGAHATTRATFKATPVNPDADFEDDWQEMQENVKRFEAQQKGGAA